MRPEEIAHWNEAADLLIGVADDAIEADDPQSRRASIAQLRAILEALERIEPAAPGDEP